MCQCSRVRRAGRQRRDGCRAASRIGPILLDASRSTVPAKPAFPAFDAERALQLARATFDIEARALLDLKARQGESFGRTCRAMLECRGRVVVMGMGKSGHVGRKIAATLASTGTPAMFVHPGEASHGDLGMVAPGDVVLAISNSGESDEIAAIVPAIKRLGVTLVAMTGHVESSLGRHADVVVSSAVDQEACPLNLAPTASTTAQMALGDALAVALLDARGFREEDFARSHPGGSLGRRLLTHVRDVMRSGADIPAVPLAATLADAVIEMSGKGMGMTAVLDADNRVAGVFTDGDLRRCLGRVRDLGAERVAGLMTREPRTIGPERLAIDCVELMEASPKVTQLLVVDAEQRLVGALHLHDLFRARVV